VQPAQETIELKPDDLLELHRRMNRVRRFEEATSRLYRDSEIPGFVHVSIGQEATSVGATWPLRPTDLIVTTHRGHGHCLAKGADMYGMFAELMGRVTGTCVGRGGSMHIAEYELGVLGANGIVGAGLPIAVGAAAALRQQDRDDVVVAFFGDGAVAQGAFHEAVNLAAVWKLPVLFVCENNHYAEFSRSDAQHPVPPAQRAKAYGIPGHAVDGNDVVAVVDLVEQAVARMRSGSGPEMIEADTYRWHGHYEGDPERYRDAEEVARWQGNDPLIRTAALLDAGGLESRRLEIERLVTVEVDTAVAAAREAPEPDVADLTAFVTRPRSNRSETSVPPDGEPYRIMDAVHDALADEMESDPTVWLAGIDIAAGNVFGLTRGLADRFPGRVLDTPISETAIMGLAVGGAMAGTKPVVEIMYLDFIGVCFDQIMNQAAKLGFMTGGHAQMSLVVRTQFGSGRSSGAQHSQSLEALLAHIPGLTVVMPSTPADTYGLLRAAIADPNPVLVIDHRLLYGFKGPKPDPNHYVSIGKAAIRRPGEDVTLVSWSRMAHDAMAAAEVAAERGIDVEVIDLRTVSPFDEPAIVDSVKKTGRLLIAHEAVMSGGLGAEIAARVADAAFWHLDAPIIRVAPPFIPVPYSPPLEAAWLPGQTQILAALDRLAAV
jgi:2-oxoisovalerate dehydrogenase E1 component